MKEKFLDSNVLIHAFLKPKKNLTQRDSEIKQKSMEIVKNLQASSLKVIITTAQIFEVANILESWLSHQAAKEILDFVVTAPNIKIYAVTTKDIDDALVILERYHDNKIGFNDCVTYVAMKNVNIHEILSFDKHFDTLDDINRVEE
jgi:predicted nucleic acid-binding protein